MFYRNMDNLLHIRTFLQRKHVVRSYKVVKLSTKFPKTTTPTTYIIILYVRTPVPSVNLPDHVLNVLFYALKVLLR